MSAVNVFMSDKRSARGKAGQDGSVNIVEADLLLLTAGKQSVCLRVVMQERVRMIQFQAGQTMLLACDHVSLQFGGAEMFIRHLGVNSLCKLLSFLDEVESIRTIGQDVLPLVSMPFDPALAESGRALDAWFLSGILQKEESILHLVGFLRRLESYWLVRFLLSESSRHKNVGLLGREYGLSYSHFRRVCKIVLGNSVKSEMKVWRAARSLIEAIEGMGSMTEVAIRNGYASSSHFSTEIKKLFGRSPRSMTAPKN